MNCVTPVALFVFNRPRLAERVFEAIRRARPPRLFLIADGPRHAEDEAKCAASRALAGQVDWDCEVLTNFCATNLGCGHRVASGLDWVFAQTNEAIILEDDCVPQESFFGYCDEMLAHYRDDRRVMHIAGSSFFPLGCRRKHSYYFSKYALVWGWASWSRAWKYYRFGVPSWPEFKSTKLPLLCPDPIEAAHWGRRFDPIFAGRRVDTWDYQWSYTLWERHGLAAVPMVNLVSNIGAGDDATHSKNSRPRHDSRVADLGELIHPPTIAHDPELDRIIFDELYGGKRMRRRATLSYQLAKPLRMLRRLQERFAAPSALANNGTIRQPSDKAPA